MQLRSGNASETRRVGHRAYSLCLSEPKAEVCFLSSSCDADRSISQAEREAQGQPEMLPVMPFKSFSTRESLCNISMLSSG
ncbi:hypothetical protein MHYP_G00190310 [Metynnis hypsauchen]